MSTVLSPIISRFETEEQASSYELWMRSKVEKSLADPRPSIPHDQVMAKMYALVKQENTLQVSES